MFDWVLYTPLTLVSQEPFLSCKLDEILSMDYFFPYDMGKSKRETNIFLTTKNSNKIL